MKMRNINLNGGNYNENIEGDFIQGKSIVREEVNINGKKTIKETITTNNNGEIHRVVNNYTDEDTNLFGDIAEMFSNIKSKVVRNNSITSSNSQVVQGNNNQVIQNASRITNIDKAEGLHIGDTINQVVQGNGNKVSQSMFTNMSIGGDISIGNVTQSASTKASIFNKDKEEIIKAEERLRRSKKPHVEEELPDFWLDDEDTTNSNTILRKTFLDVFNNELKRLDEESTNSEYLKAASYIIQYFEDAPMILNYVLETKKDLSTYMSDTHDNPTVATNLFSKVIKNL